MGYRKAEKSNLVKRLLTVYGDKCFVCKEPLGFDITIEHIIPKCFLPTPDKPYHNYALSHSQCNTDRFKEWFANTRKARGLVVKAMVEAYRMHNIKPPSGSLYYWNKNSRRKYS